jgi:hypothetical protein
MKMPSYVAMAALLLLLAVGCETTSVSPKADAAGQTAQLATDAAKLSTQSDKALKEVADARSAGKPRQQLAGLLEIAQAQNALSFAPGVTTTAFNDARTAISAAAGEAVDLCRTGGTDPRDGPKCALAFAFLRTNDGVRISRAFSDSLAAKSWAAVTLRAEEFKSEVEVNWPKFVNDTKEFGGAGDVQKVFDEMRTRNACVIQRGQGSGSLLNEMTNPQAQGAIAAYRDAAAAASRGLGLIPVGQACAQSDSSQECAGTRENVLATTCDKYNGPR